MPTPVVSSVNVPANGTYTYSQMPNSFSILNFTVNFSEYVFVTGTPRIALTIGETTRYANCTTSSGSGSSQSHTFSYSVASSDIDTNGITVNSLGLNGGTIMGSGYMGGSGTPADLTLNSVGNTINVLVGATDPVVTSVTVPSNGTYKTDDNLNFTVNWNKAITVTGTPRISLTIGSTTRYANYLSGSGSTALVFRHTVLSGDLDTNGIAVNSLGLNGGTMKDAANNNAVLTLNSVGSTTSVLVDAVAPTITSVSAPSNATYKTDDNLNFTVGFDENVVVTGTPRIVLTIGSTTRYANYLSGSGSTSLIFRHTVLSGDLDTNGISVTINIDLNSGTMKDAAGNDADLYLKNADVAYGGNQSGILVDAVAPTVSNVEMPWAADYITTNNIDFTVEFSESVNVTGTPRLVLTIGSTAYANYLSGSGSATLTFRHTVVGGDSTAGGYLALNSLEFNSGTIKDAAGNNAVLTLNSVNYHGGVTVNSPIDTVAPTVSSVSVPSNATYITDDNLNFTVNWSESVTVTGTPRISLTIGSTTRYANYLSGSGSSALIFRHTVLSGDLDTNGIAVNSLGLNSGTLKDAAGNDATLTLNSVGSTTSVLVDAISPAVTSVTVPSNATYTVDQNLNFTVVFDEAVAVTGTPRITLTIGSTTRYANYLSGTGTTSIVFRHTVLSGDVDANGITVGTLGLNSGTMKDAAGNNAVLTLNSVGSTTNVLVGTTTEVGSVNTSALAVLNTQIVTNTNLAYDQNPTYSTSSITYTIVTPTTYGKILLNGATLGVNNTFTQQNIDNGNVVYVRSNFNATDDSLVVGPVVGTTATANVTLDIELLVHPTIVMKIISRLKRILMG